MSSLSEPRRPRLLSQNRKLRHLKGLSLRNLSFAPTHLRTTDDTSLSYRRLESLKETHVLQGSKSSDNLRSEALRHESKKLEKPQLQRRTSLSFGALHTSPVARQKRLEALYDAAVGDVFFSIHVHGEPDPVYVSEVKPRATNFNFQFFDVSSSDANVSRSCKFTIRVWVQRPKREDWIFLVEEVIDLRDLNFIGTLLDRKFPPNALIFHLEDGIYSLDFPERISEPKQAPSIGTSTYSALMKLANLKSSIDDAMETRDKIMGQIDDILKDTPTDMSKEESVKANQAEANVSAQQRINKTAERKRDDLRESLRSRRAAIQKGRDLQAEAEEDILNNREKLESSKVLAEETEQAIRGQRRRICSDLSDIFNITPTPNAPPLSFNICGLPLPNSTYDATNAKNISEDALSAALGLVVLLARHLHLYLSCFVPYPLYHYGSRSIVRDDISRIQDLRGSSQRNFPLYLPRGGSTSGQWRFEYAWFLLNKDIEALCAKQGLKVVDIRHTLPNLKYLLYVCSAGTEDVPERKKGGVRGLWQGRLKGRMGSLVGDGETASLDGSRRGSYDSEGMSEHAEELREAVLKQNSNGADLPFEETKLSLRTKGLRESVI